MVRCQEPSPLKGSKHSLQHHPHDAVLVNAHSFVFMWVEARCRPCHSTAHCRHMKRQPSLCHCWPCRGRHYYNCRPRLCRHLCCHCRCCCCCNCFHCPRQPLLLRSPSTIAADISVALPSAIAVAIATALAIRHCRLHHHQPWQLPYPLSITVAIAVGHF